jgi:predicted metalloprotease with PDZ domain
MKSNVVGRILSLLVVLASPAGAAPSPVGDTVRYTVAPVLADRVLTGLSVEIRFAGDADGETLLHLPNRWAGSNELWRHLSDIEVEGARTVREDGPAERIITHSPGTPLTVRYRVRSAYTADPGFDYEKARPLILPGWFFFHGEGMFADPDGRQDAPAQFAWKGFPADWKLASDLDHLSVRPGKVQEIIESVAIGGPDLQIFDRDINGARLRVAIRGSWRFTPEAFAGMVEKIVRTENELWSVPARPFVVSVAPLGGSEAGYSFYGTGRADAFSVAATPGVELADGARLLAHEYLHVWFPGELGGAPVQDEQLTYWFGEGFTDFYAAYVLLRAGLWSLADYVDDLNRTLMRYGTSPARKATAADVLRSFWTDQAVQKLPYDQGHLLAHVLAYRIRKASEGRTGLHDVLRLQHTRAQTNDAEGRRIPGATLFPAILREVTGLDIAPDLARHIESGQQVLLPADLFDGCFTVTTVTQPEFHRGFDIDATERAGMIITGVNPESPAHAAGIRNGMRLIRREAGTTGDSSVEIAYRVQDGDTERVIRYLPQGTAQVTLQRVLPTPEMAAQACEQRVRAVPAARGGLEGGPAPRQGPVREPSSRTAWRARE